MKVTATRNYHHLVGPYLPEGTEIDIHPKAAARLIQSGAVTVTRQTRETATTNKRRERATR